MKAGNPVMAETLDFDLICRMPAHAERVAQLRRQLGLPEQAP